MRKFAMFLAILVCAGLSFSTMAISYSDPIYVQTCCMHRVTTNLLESAYNNYEVYDGEGCVASYQYFYDQMLYLDGVMNGEGGVSDYYYQMQGACSEGTPSECLAAKRNFYSNSRSARQEFAAGKTLYLYYLRGAIACGTSRQQIFSDLSGLASGYRQCMMNGCARPPLPPFPPLPPRPRPPILPPFPGPIDIIR